MLTQWYRQRRKRRPAWAHTRAWRLLVRYHEGTFRLGGGPQHYWRMPDGTEVYYRDVHSGHQWLWRRLMGAAGQMSLRDAVAALAREVRRYP